jgi:signal transduction histidine kinase
VTRGRPTSLEGYLRYQSIRWAIVGFLVTLSLAVPCVLYSTKMASERQLLVAARSAARAFRPMLLQDHVRDAQFQMRNALELQMGESVVVRDTALNAIYPLEDKDKSARCRSPGSSCWESSFRSVSILYPIYFDEQSRSKLYGYIELTMKPALDLGVISLLIILLLAAFIGQAFGLSSGLRHSSRQLIVQLSGWATYLRTNPGSRPTGSVRAPYDELQSMQDAVDGLHLEVERLREQSAREAKAEGQLTAIGLVAAQVSHDIRSPLAALEMVLQDLGNVAEERRILVRSAISRIKDIANSLLQKNRDAIRGGSITSPESTEPKVEALVSSLIESVATEKRLTIRSRIGIEIHCRMEQASYGSFALIQPTELKRALSNLVNNAIEALPEKGFVEISLRSLQDTVEIVVTDNGCGIPPELLERLGRRGETHRKVDGSGLGLYHAETSARSWGGSLRIESTLGVGTSVVMVLPRITPPNWFVPSILVPADGTVVVLDDDASVHGIWSERFANFTSTGQLKLVHLSTAAQLKSWVNADSVANSDALYLTDYELIGQDETGLDLIAALGIARQSVLVTSRFEDTAILEKCRSLDVRLIPKPMAALVPIHSVGGHRPTADISPVC